MIVIEATTFLIAAGRIDLPRFWTYMAIKVLCQSSVYILIFTHFPKAVEVLNARGKIKVAKTWDRIFVILYSLFTIIAMPAIAGMDVGRYGWSNLNVWWMIPGIIFLLAATFLNEWAIIENEFFETTVRIQEEREQKVVSTGPYAIVRHPGYIATIFLDSAFPLISGSFYALFISMLSALLIIIRTILEDRILHQGLDGYAAYARKVKYRLLPRIW